MIRFSKSSSRVGYINKLLRNYFIVRESKYRSFQKYVVFNYASKASTIFYKIFTLLGLLLLKVISKTTFFDFFLKLYFTIFAIKKRT